MTAQSAARAILEIIPLVMRFLGSKFRREGRLPVEGHFRLLFMLTEGPHNLSELAEKHSVTLPTMSNSVSRLVERGLVRRTQAPHDRRQVVIELTDNGRALLQAIQIQAEAHIVEILDPLSPAELEELLRGLTILQTVFSPKPPEVSE